LFCPFGNPTHIPRQHLISRLPADDTGSDEEIFEVSEKNWKNRVTQYNALACPVNYILDAFKSFPRDENSPAVLPGG
jgi:hypothetical protein